jgi:uncharacterized OsmC-like protein
MTTTTTEHPHPNGGDLATLRAARAPRRGNPPLPQSQFRACHRWVEGVHSVSTYDGFHGVGQEMAHRQPTQVVSDHPEVLVGTDHAPTPVEYLLHGIAACPTAGIANIAATRGVTLTKVESSVEGDIDLLGILGLSDGTVRNGYEQVRVTFHIEGDADDETLRAIVEQSRRRSAVYDALTQPTPVVIDVVTG